MDLILPVFYTILQIFSLVALGFCMRKFWNWSSLFFEYISKFLVTITLPLLFFTRMVYAQPESLLDIWIFPISALIFLSISTLLGYLVFTILPFSQKGKRAGIALASFGNSGYMPISLIEIFPLTVPFLAQRFGTELPLLFIAGYLFLYSPLLWSIGNILISGKKPKLKAFFSPPIFGIIAGLLVSISGFSTVLTNESLPFLPIVRSAQTIGEVTVPLVLIAIGAMIANLSFDKTRLKELLVVASGALSVRYLMLPALFFTAYFLVLRHMDLPATHIWVLFLVNHVPPATNLSIMANRAGINQDYAAFTLFVSYILYLFVLPLYLMLFLNLPGIR